MMYADRHEAGRRLAEALKAHAGTDAVVLALPRGGVVVGYEVAHALGLQLDVIVARKLGAPHNPEFGFGAVGPGGVRYVDEQSAETLRLTAEQIDRIAAQEAQEVERRLRRYRGEQPMPDLAGRTAIIVDDGLATGVTARAAVHVVRQWHPASVVLAVPVAPPQTARELRDEVDELVCVDTPAWFMAVGQFYHDFSQTTDEEVVELLRRARAEFEGKPGGSTSS